MARILIVEDDVELQKEMSILLEKNGYEVDIITDFSNVLEEILHSNADLVLLDIQIPNLNGEYVLKEVRKESNIPIIMVTSQNSEMDEVLSLSYGADDYITKPYHPSILLLHMEAILKRTQHTSQILSYRHIRLNMSKGTIESEQAEYPLSKNEMTIFYYLLCHVGTIVTREEIMNYLWGTEEFIDDNTLTVNINRLRSRLEEVGLKDVIETKRGQGYLLQ